MKATTPKPQKKSIVSGKKVAKSGGSVHATSTGKKGRKMSHVDRIVGSIAGDPKMRHIDRIVGTTVTARNSTSGQYMCTRAEKIAGKRKEPAWVRQEVKGLMDALSGR